MFCILFFIILKMKETKKREREDRKKEVLPRFCRGYRLVEVLGHRKRCQHQFTYVWHYSCCSAVSKGWRNNTKNNKKKRKKKPHIRCTESKEGFNGMGDIVWTSRSGRKKWTVATRLHIKLVCQSIRGLTRREARGREGERREEGNRIKPFVFAIPPVRNAH